LLTHLTGFLSLATAMRPHEGIGLDQAHRTITTGVNALTLSIHREIHADRWMLYHHRSTFAGDGITHSECRIYDEGRHLLASFTVEAMLRAMNTEGVPSDRPAM
jgi:acyl-CoA thioesterase